MSHLSRLPVAKQHVSQVTQCTLLTAAFLCTSVAPSTAQSIVTDGTTPTTLSGPANCLSGDCTITGGTRFNSTSSVLFHSFSQFDVDTGATVTFSPDAAITDIFSRVTQLAPGNESHINGTLSVNGNANLYLLNPNGFIFGENASINIPGSFLTTTADSFYFENNQSFGHSDSSVPALLTINTPVGLQFGQNPSPIHIEGNGHNLQYNSQFFNVVRTAPTTSLSASPDQTLGLIAGEITIDGGNLLAESGQVEIGSIGSTGRVSLDTQAWTFDYSQVNQFDDINLINQSSIDVSSHDGGSIRLFGRNIELADQSALLSQISHSGGGSLLLNATERIQLVDTDRTPPPTPPSFLTSIPTSAYVQIAPGATGDGSSSIVVNSPNIDLINGGQIGLSTGGLGNAGTMSVTSSSVNLVNGSNITPSALFSIVLPAFGTPPGAQGGNLTITADQLSVTDGGQIATTTFGAGNAGDLTINATDINVSGFNNFGPSTIVAASPVPVGPIPNGSGQGGDISLTAQRIQFSNGGQASVSTNSANAAGNLSVTAREQLDIDGQTPNGRSGLFASTNIGTGQGGSITVDTDTLTLSNGGTLNASNFPSRTPGPPPGSGAAGDIYVSARSLIAESDSLITTNTVSGDGANIHLQLGESLVLNGTSRISTDATGTATGGSIFIDTSTIVALNNSDITANSVNNFGGRVVINTNSLIGTEFREQLTPESDITASSDLGVEFSGSVDINMPEVDPTSGIDELPEAPASDNQIVAACEGIDTNAFIATGQGGVPADANHLLTGETLWNDFRHLAPETELLAKESDRTENQSDLPARTVDPAPIVEARSWTYTEDGTIVLSAVATQHNSATLPTPSCTN